jgi:enamine deaminase RidA (YjgF/YER057c/UK114 family)
MFDIAGLPHFRAVRDEYIDTANPPASTAVQVLRLFRPEFLLEVEAIAVVRAL